MSGLPDRLAIDGDGFVWRVYPTHWSMPPVNDDNTEPPEPVTYYVRLDGVDAEPCLTHGSAFYDEALCGLQMARLYHETGSTLSGLAWVDEQYGECRWTEAMAEGDTTDE